MNLILKKDIRKLILTSIITTMAFSSHGVESTLWQQFKTAKSNNQEPTLPDFSYAGYAYSEKSILDTSNWPVFKVSDYGAYPGDDQFDDEGIQKAIDAAEANGKGIVQFESGKYRVSPNDNTDEQITIQSSNIVLKGQGSDVNGTIIFMDNMKANNGWTMFRASPKNVVHNILGTVTSDAERETFVITVSNPEKFKINQNIQLRTDSVEFGINYYDPLVIPQEWTRLWTDGFKLREMHTVAAIDGNKITLGEPLHISIKSTDKIQVRSIEMLENVGIEDIRFKGNWNNYPADYRHMAHLDSDSEYNAYPKEFIHHHDKYHDYAWNALLVDRIHNGWIKNVEFRDFNTGLLIFGSSAFTVTNTKFSGKKGHNSVHTRGSYGVLIKDSRDSAGHNHGASIGYGSVGAVYLRYKSYKGQHMDSHTGNPFTTLFDNVNGNFDFNGGPYESRPHHGKHLVAWNFKFEEGPDFYDFWPDVKTRNRYALPFMIGAHGQVVDFKSDSVSSKESLGQKVEPASLFEAQLGLRLLPTYTYLGSENESKTFNDEVDIAFGAEGNYSFIYNVSGTINFNTSTFGDPAPGAKKSVFYRPAKPKKSLYSKLPSRYNYIADDGETIHITEPVNVAFGAGEHYVFKYNVTSDMPCTIAAFGANPNPGVTKKCYITVR